MNPMMLPSRGQRIGLGLCLSVTLSLTALSGCASIKDLKAKETPQSVSQRTDGQTAKPRPIEQPIPRGPQSEAVVKQELEYKRQIVAEVKELQAGTKEFLAQYRAGGGKATYPLIHAKYEKLQPIAERFNPTQFAIINLDRLMNEREVDYQLLDETDKHEWTGWHRIEKDLWKHTETERKALADDLQEKTDAWVEMVSDSTYDPFLDDMCKDAVALLEEAVLTKATGEEEKYAKSDLLDLEYTIAGAKRAVDLVLPVLVDKNLVEETKRRFAEMEQVLNGTKIDGQYPPYDKLSFAQRQALLDAVNALRRPVSKLNKAAVVDVAVSEEKAKKAADKADTRQQKKSNKQ